MRKTTHGRPLTSASIAAETGVGNVKSATEEQDSASLAPRLKWLRAQMDKILRNLEGVDVTLCNPMLPRDDQGGAHAETDVITVVGDLERLANGIGEVAARIAANVGQV